MEDNIINENSFKTFQLTKAYYREVVKLECTLTSLVAKVSIAALPIVAILEGIYEFVLFAINTLSNCLTDGSKIIEPIAPPKEEEIKDPKIIAPESDIKTPSSEVASTVINPLQPLEPEAATRVPLENSEKLPTPPTSPIQSLKPVISAVSSLLIPTEPNVEEISRESSVPSKKDSILISDSEEEAMAPPPLNFDTLEGDPLDEVISEMPPHPANTVTSDEAPLLDLMAEEAKTITAFTIDLNRKFPGTFASLFVESDNGLYSFIIIPQLTDVTNIPDDLKIPMKIHQVNQLQVAIENKLKTEDRTLKSIFLASPNMANKEAYKLLLKEEEQEEPFSGNQTKYVTRTEPVEGNNEQLPELTKFHIIVIEHNPFTE